MSKVHQTQLGGDTDLHPIILAHLEITLAYQITWVGSTFDLTEDGAMPVVLTCHTKTQLPNNNEMFLIIKY